MTALVELLVNRGEDSGVDITGDWKAWDGGPGDIWVWGNLGGGQVDLHAAIDESAPVVVCGTTSSGTSPTSSSVTKFNFKQSTKIRAVLTGSTSPSSGIYVKVN